MGYPMTFGRFINRNRLSEGGYGTPIATVNLSTTSGTTLSEADAMKALAPHWREELKTINGRWGNLLGDLRRLERDGQDEGAVCKHIAQRTGIDADLVAVVLKEFLSW